MVEHLFSILKTLRLIPVTSLPPFRFLLFVIFSVFEYFCFSYLAYMEYFTIVLFFFFFNFNECMLPQTGFRRKRVCLFLFLTRPQFTTLDLVWRMPFLSSKYAISFAFLFYLVSNFAFLWLMQRISERCRLSLLCETEYQFQFVRYLDLEIT